MSSKKVTLLVIYTVKAGKMPELMRIFPEMITYTRKEKGNLAIRPFSSATEENKFFIYEEFVNESALEAHRNTPYYSNIITKKVLPLLEHREVHRLAPLS